MATDASSDATAVTMVALGDLEVDEDAFQWRADVSTVESRLHVKQLARHLREHQEPLTPLLVLPVGAKYVVVDGHHRLEAYKLAHWERPVPVEVFTGTAQEARERALEVNSRLHLHLGLQNQREAAWRLSKEQYFDGIRHSKAEIMRLTSVSEGTVANMRRILRERGEQVRDRSWAEVLRMDFGQDYSPDPDWKQKKAEKVAEVLKKKLDIHLVNDVDILAMALEMVSSLLPRALVGQWPEEAERVAEDIQEERKKYPQI